MILLPELFDESVEMEDGGLADMVYPGDPDSVVNCGGRGSGVPGPCPTGVKVVPKAPDASRVEEDRSKFIGQKVGKAEHVHSSNVEKQVAAALKGTWEEDNAAYDVSRGKDGFEVKSLLKGSKQSISVHEDALLRKVEWQGAEQGRTFHTVAVDERGTYEGGAYKDNYSGHRMYYKRGSGRYSLSQMHPVSSVAELNRLSRLPDSQLPEKARGSLPKGKEVAALRIAAEKAHASRLLKDRKRKARLKAEAKAEAERQAGGTT